MIVSFQRKEKDNSIDSCLRRNDREPWKGESIKKSSLLIFKRIRQIDWFLSLQGMINNVGNGCVIQKNVLQKKYYFFCFLLKNMIL